MSEFKFACPVCGQRMAVDSSATGAQVECPTCFQIIIVPKAPAEGSKYQLSATQFIKPVVLPPPPKPSVATVRPQRKSAVLIFGLILVCAIVMALFVREKLAGSRQPVAAVLTNAVPEVTSPLWMLHLTNVTFPDRPAAGEIHGHDFVCREAVFLQNGLLILQSERGWRSPMSAGISVATNFFSTNLAEVLNNRSFDVSTNHSGRTPSVSLFWQEGNLRVMEMFTNGFAMKLQFGSLSSNKHQLPGKIYLCLPDATKSYIAGTFTAEVRNFSRPRRRHRKTQ